MGTEPPLSMRSTDFGLELAKLLLQVVWADNEVEPREVEALKRLATELGLTGDHLLELESYLDGSAPLPPPNLAALKARKVEVMKALKRLLTELDVGDEENEAVEQISMLLG